MAPVAFFTFRTPHFRVIHPEGLDSLARRAAAVGEACLPRLCQDLLLDEKGPFPVIDLVLTDMDDESNGFSSVLGHRIEIFARPDPYSAAGELPWIDRVVAHELAHQVTYLALRRRLKIYGELFQLAFIPAWFMEGLAQFEAESWDANRKFLLSAAVRKNLLLPRPRLYGYAMGHNPVEARLLYEQGHSLYRAMARRCGKDVGGRVLKNLTLWRPNFSRALKKVTGWSEKEWMREHQNTLNRGDRNPDTHNPGMDLYAGFRGRMEQVFSLKEGGGGTFFTGIERVEVYNRNLYFVDGGGVPRKIDGPLVNPFFSLSPDKKTVYYSKLTRRGGGSLRNALYQYSSTSGRRPLDGILGEDPCGLPGGGVAFVRTLGGKSTLWRYERERHSLQPLPLPPSVTLVFSPAFGQGRLYFSLVETAGGRKIGSVDENGLDFRIEIEKPGFDCRFPAPAPDGRLCYTSDETGIFNLFVRETDGSVRQVTNDRFGVFAPAAGESSDSVDVTAVRDGGRNFGVSVFRVPVRPLERPFPAAPPSPDTVRPAPPPQPETPRENYSPATALSPRLAFPVAGGDLRAPRNAFAGAGAWFSDPLDKWTLGLSIFHYLYLKRQGFEAQIGMDRLFPSVDLEFYQKYQDGGPGPLLRQGAAAKISFPLDFCPSPRVEQRLSMGGRLMVDQTNEAASRHLRRVPLFLEYALGRWDGFFGNALHPLSSAGLRLELSAADHWSGSDYHYQAAQVEGHGAVELGRSFSVIFGRFSLFHQFKGGNTRFLFPLEELPRGLAQDSSMILRNYLRPTLELRAPPCRQLGLSFLGLYFEMLTASIFWDGLFAPELSSTMGLQLRQRIFWMGKGPSVVDAFLAYDPKAGAPWSLGLGLNRGI